MKQLQYPFEVWLTLNYWEMSGSFLMILISLLSVCVGVVYSLVLVLQKKCKVPQILTAVTCYSCSWIGN